MGDFPQESRPASLVLPRSNYGTVHQRIRQITYRGLNAHARLFLDGGLTEQARKNQP